MNDNELAHLIRLEGVNLSAVLDDTDDISVRRGAGLMLRQAVRDVAGELPELRPISLGASVGLFELAAGDPETMVSAVADYLGGHDQYRFLTFVVDSAPLDTGFPATLELVTARNRFRQFRQPTLALPESTGGDLWCRYDQLRPALPKTQTHNVKGEVASPSVLERFEYGRKQRNAFYSDELGEDVPFVFTDNLSDLAQPGPRQDFGNLNGKLAVIYLDGNSFGALQRGCDTPAALRGFDVRIQDYRRSFLKRLVQQAGRGDASYRNGNAVRLEILLWGGDEILLVVPAWKGMETLQLFYEASADWTFVDTPLTHAGGLVFCHHKTPIAQVIRAAKALAEETKRFSRDEDRFDYLVLESVDYPTESPSRFRQLRYGVSTATALEPLGPFASRSQTRWSERSRYVGDFLDTLPRGAIYDVATAYVHHRDAPDGSAQAAFEKRVKRLLEVSGNDLHDRLWDKLFLYLLPDSERARGYDHAGWLHLVELWDYLTPTTVAGRVTT